MSCLGELVWITRSELIMVLIALNRTVFVCPVSVVSQRDCKSNAFFWTTKTFRKIIWFLFLPFNKGFANGWQWFNTAVLISLESGCKSTDYFCNYQMFLRKNCFKTCFCCSKAWNQGIKRNYKFEDLKIWRILFEDLTDLKFWPSPCIYRLLSRRDVRLVLCDRGL